MINSSLTAPDKINDFELRFDSFDGGNVLFNKKKGRLPSMGWNSWNAFGSGNTEALTKVMAEKIIQLGLDKLGYKYLVLDDGCYRPERVEGRLSNEPVKFPSGFKALSDFIHDKGLLFGMYNDIGTNLCAGAYVGTCGHEAEDTKSYVEWGVDFLKVDNCYYLWDNATFSNPENVKYVFTPAIHSVSIKNKNGFTLCLNGVKDGIIKGNGGKVSSIDGKDYITGLGTFDGTGPEHSPVGDISAELVFEVDIPLAGEYELFVECVPGKEPGMGSWLQILLGEKENTKVLFDDEYAKEHIYVNLSAGKNILRICNHRRQENTLHSYAKFLEGLNEADPDNNIVLSMCEWGKNQPQSWGYKVGDSWRILNDIAFNVGSDGNPGSTAWEDGYTPAVMPQYNKAVVMDEFAGLDKGWNDPDMLVVGMGGLNLTQMATHFTMWCMMNSPLMLGLDLRRVEIGDSLHNIIANKDLIDLNQDPLGVQAKRIYTSLACETPDKEYITNNRRLDVLAKPLADGSVALSFINVNPDAVSEPVSVSKETIVAAIGKKMCNADAFLSAKEYRIKDLWSKSESVNLSGVFSMGSLEACENATVRICPVM